MDWQGCLKQLDLNHQDSTKSKGKLEASCLRKFYHRFDKKQTQKQVLWALERM